VAAFSQVIGVHEEHHHVSRRPPNSVTTVYVIAAS
jgi:hypothetical protein